MDYCSTCRRHLNGALVCPGCGAHTPQHAPLPYEMWRDSAAHTGDGLPPLREPEVPVDDVSPYDGPDSAPPAPTGRAARRRQRVRWRKTQRRALVATAVALVGGGLTVASMERQSTDRTQAAAAPDSEAMGIAEKQVADPTGAVPEQPAARRTEADRSPARTSSANSPREQSATTPQATPAARSVRIVQRDTLSSAATEAAGSVGSTAASAASGVAGTVTETTATPAPSATGTATGDASDTSDTSTASPAPTATETASTGLCLLVICIG
ncbi:hypothetical protein ACIPSE_27380 [Streptomyces sp. NPDC090106]|uniref:SCO2400 family protein n=1 Tax=Streptomyces sp. NPDC090106 TaxID=3365946 RepID=UPI0038058401